LAEKNNLETRNSFLGDEAGRLEKELSAAKAIVQEVGVLRNSLQAVQGEKQELEATNEFLAKEADRLEEQLLSAEAITKELENSRKTAAADAALYREKWSGLASQHKDTTEKLSSGLGAAKKEKESLELRLHEKESEAINLSMQVTQLSDVAGKQMADLGDFQHKHEVLSGKCERLRAYVRKLTAKCDEWETFHNRESQVLQQLKATLDRTRCEASVLADRFKQSDHVRIGSKASLLLQLFYFTLTHHVSTLITQLYSEEKAKACTLQYELDVVAMELTNASNS